jgi:peptidylprolyl isomerase
MKRTLLLAALLAAASATAIAAPKKAAAPAASAKPAGPTAADWRIPDPNNILVVDTNKGRIVAELYPEVAPKSAGQVLALAHEGFYNGQKFFRVIENFMDQTGDPQNTGEGNSTKPNVPGEFLFRRGADMPFAMAADQTVAEIGFFKYLPVMSQSMSLAPMTKDGAVAAWGLFCPGVLGMARANDPDSGNSQFFFMRAAYPSLEKRYTAFGRVLSGQDVVTSVKVGEPVEEPMDRMDKVRVLADIPERDRPKVRVIDTRGAWFKAELARVRADKGADFSACDVNIPAEVK